MLDFAGGTVVHINAGVAGLVCALVLGKRTGYGHENMAPHNLVLTMIGASLLWVGWFGFNAGSAVAANALAGVAMANTQIATAAAALAWMVGRVDPAQEARACSAWRPGAVGGLVAITPAAGFVNPQGALFIGLAAGVGCYAGAVWLKRALKYDDSLDAFGVHGVGGIIGALLTGLLADEAINSLGKDASVLKQAFGVGVTIALDRRATFAILWICKFDHRACGSPASRRPKASTTPCTAKPCTNSGRPTSSPTHRLARRRARPPERSLPMRVELALRGLRRRRSPQSASASAAEFDWSVNAAVTNDYVFRGVSQSAGQMTVQGGADVTYGIAYAGVWAVGRRLRRLHRPPRSTSTAG